MRLISKRTGRGAYVEIYRISADDMGASSLLSAECLQAAGVNSILPKEHGGKMFQLPILHFDENEVRSYFLLVFLCFVMFNYVVCKVLAHKNAVTATSAHGIFHSAALFPP